MHCNIYGSQKIRMYLFLSRHSILPVDTFTYLGVLVRYQLSFTERVRTTISKASGSLYMLMRILKHASSTAKRTAYFSICLPLLEYASEIWNPALKYLIVDMEKINRKAYRWAYGAKNTIQYLII